jgi:glycosyltransferase involved in cell wall biosynthesis
MELADRVTVIPGLQSNSNDIADAYHCADLFVLPSIHEPFGIVILEAWASGLPVIASRVGGIPSFVDHRVEGLLFQANNDTQLVSAVKFLAEHPEEAAKIAIEGKKKAITEFSWDNITGRLIRIYEESIRENSFRK